MLDIKLVRENTEKVIEALRKRGFQIDVQEQDASSMSDDNLDVLLSLKHFFELDSESKKLTQIIELDNTYRKLIKKADELRNTRNTVSDEIGKLKIKKQNADTLIAEIDRKSVV